MSYTLIPEAGRTLALLVRHGRTELNEGTPRLRAWADVPLDRNGELDAQVAANVLRPFDPKSICSSDLIRDMSTAGIISEMLGNLPTEVCYDLRTADMGELTEQPEDEVKDIVRAWYTSPWKQAPSGESNDSFAARLFPFVDRMLQLMLDVPQMCPIAMCGHGRLFAALDSRYNFKPPIEGKMPFPGGVATIKQAQDGRIKFEFLGPTEDVIADK